MESSKALVAGLYNRCAPNFDQVGPKTFAVFGENLVELIGIEAGAHVLDVATGRGANLFPAAERVTSSGRVVGIDLAGEMVRETAREVEQRGYQYVSVEQMDAEALAFSDASFDYVLCGYAIFWFHDFKKALAEFLRVLRVAGKAGITMASGLDPRWQWYYDLLAKFNQENSLHVDYGFSGPGINHNVEGLEKALTEVGFSNVHTVKLDHEFVYQGQEEWWEALWTHGSRSPLEQMPPEMLARFKEECLTHLAQEDGSKGYVRSQPTTYTLATKAA